MPTGSRDRTSAPVAGLLELQARQGIYLSFLSDANLKALSYQTCVSLNGKMIDLDYLLSGTITVVLPESPLGPCGPGVPDEPRDMQPLNTPIIITSAQSFKLFMEFPFCRCLKAPITISISGPLFVIKTRIHEMTVFRLFALRNNHRGIARIAFWALWSGGAL